MNEHQAPEPIGYPGVQNQSAPAQDAPTQSVQNQSAPTQALGVTPGLTGVSARAAAPQPEPDVPATRTEPNVPLMLCGVVLLIAAGFVAVWRLIDSPNWGLLALMAAAIVGGGLLVLSGLTVVLRRVRADRAFDDQLARGRDH